MISAQPGDLLAGRYRLQNVIGNGGMGIVWLAADELLNRDVAVKETIRPQQLDEAEWAIVRGRSLSEARTAARLSHPGIVSVYDVFDHDDRPWIVMQLVPYPSLRDAVRISGPLAPAQAAGVGKQILAAIRAAHAAGVLHRDIKPANVLLSPDGRAFLTDFGLAVADGSPKITTSGLIMGSPAYMAPERANGEPATAASDLWSLGATLYAAVEGRDPFERNSTVAVLTAISTADPDAPSRAGLLWPVISGLLRKDPYLRLDADETERLLDRVPAAGLAETGPLQLTRRLSLPLVPEPGAAEPRAAEPRAAEPQAAEPRAAVTSPDPVSAAASSVPTSRTTALTRVLAGAAAVVAVAFAIYLSAGADATPRHTGPAVTGSVSPSPATHSATPVVSRPSSSATPRAARGQTAVPPKKPPPPHKGKPKKHHGHGHGNGNGNGNGNAQ